MQCIPLHVDDDEEEDLTQSDIAEAPASQQDTRITTENFEDVHGEPINDVIQCTAPKKLARAWLAGSVTMQTLDEGLCFLVNESFDREHPANLFMENVRLSYQFYSVSDLSKEVMAAIQDGDVTSEALLEFIQSCLVLTKQYQKRNEKHCSGFMRYTPQKSKSGGGGGKKARVDQAARRSFR